MKTNKQIADSLYQITKEKFGFNKEDIIRKKNNGYPFPDVRMAISNVLRNYIKKIGVVELGTYVNRNYTNVVHYSKKHFELYQKCDFYTELYNTLNDSLKKELNPNKLSELYSEREKLTRSLEWVEKRIQNLTYVKKKF